MFKNKNKITKISNSIFLVLAVMSLLSLISLIFNTDKDVGKATLYSNIILMTIYVISFGTILWITNKKIDLYKDDYPMSRQIFNLFIVLSLISAILMISINVLSGIFFNTFSLYSLLVVLLCFVPIYVIAYKEVSKEKLLNKDNSKKVNICNLIVVILVINYAAVVISTILQMLFHGIDIVNAITNLCVAFIWLSVVMIAYKLINKEEKHK